jgi:hypothetical protein
MGLIFDLHGWRGFSWERDLFHWRLTMGPLTLMLCRFCVTDRLAIIAKSLDDVKSKLEGK